MGWSEETSLGWFVVFWEDEEVEEASPCNYCVEKSEEWYTVCTQIEQKFFRRGLWVKWGRQTCITLAEG